MIRAGHVIAERLGAVLAKEDCACIADFGHRIPRIGGHNFKVLGRDLIYHADGGVNVGRNENAAVVVKRSADDVGSGECLEILFDFRRYILREFLGSCHEDGACKLVVLGL